MSNYAWIVPLLIICGTCMMLSSNVVFDDPYIPMPFSTMSNEERFYKIIGDDSNWLNGIENGKQAFIENNTVVYDNAIKYCTLVAERDKINSLNDPNFKYYIGVINGYEEATIDSLKIK